MNDQPDELDEEMDEPEEIYILGPNSLRREKWPPPDRELDAG